MAKSVVKKPSEVSIPEEQTNRDFISIPIYEIDVGFNVREQFGDLTDLIESVKLHGILEPVIVQGQENGRYLLLAGGRRYNAALEAGLLEIPAVAYNPALSESEKSEIQFIENFHRLDLNPVEEGRALKRLADTGMTQKEIAERLSVSQPYVANRIRLLNVDDRLINLVIEGKTTPSHIHALMAFEKIVPDLIFKSMVNHAIEKMEDPDYDVTVDRISNRGFYTYQFPDKDPGDDSWLIIDHVPFDHCKESKCDWLWKLGFTTFCFRSSCYNNLKKELDDEKVKEALEKKKQISESNPDAENEERQDIIKNKIRNEQFIEFYDLVDEQVKFHLDEKNRPGNLIKNSFIYFVRNNLYLLSPKHRDYYEQVIGDEYSIDRIGIYTDSQILDMFLYNILMSGMDFHDVVLDEKARTFNISKLLDMGVFLPDSVINYDFYIPENVDTSLPVCEYRKSTNVDDVFECGCANHNVLYNECLECGGKSE